MEHQTKRGVEFLNGSFGDEFSENPLLNQAEDGVGDEPGIALRLLLDVGFNLCCVFVSLSFGLVAGYETAEGAGAGLEVQAALGAGFGEYLNDVVVVVVFAEGENA